MMNRQRFAMLRAGIPVVAVLAMASGQAWSEPVPAEPAAEAAIEAPEVEVPADAGQAAAPGAIAEEAEAPAEPEVVILQTKSPAEVIEGIIAQLGVDGDLDRQERSRAVDLLRGEMGRTSPDPDEVAYALADAYPDLGRAIDLMIDEKTDEALALFGRLADHRIPSVKAHAKFYRAQLLVSQERFEEAYEILAGLVDQDLDQTLFASDIVFLKAVSQVQTLRRAEALATLESFTRSFPQASERMMEGARQMIYDLRIMLAFEGSLYDVQDRMAFARRKLGLEESGEPTQAEHRRIIEMLEKLIEEAEQQEQQQSQSQSQSQGQGQGQGQGQQQQQGSGPPGGDPSSPAGQSQQVVGQGGMGSQTDRRTQAQPWGGLPDYERERVISALRQNFPDRYRELVEQYYDSIRQRDLARPEQSGEAYDED